ncbi:hypothetical protein T484DRAFT_1799587 [Baffinella frigidus]|nr:hypothetical protein T484DRAFT_1799587 [Cryptophyta sp. CCMP2293]
MNICLPPNSSFFFFFFFAFHAQDGSGYTFLADRIIQIDSVNPQVGPADAKRTTIGPKA